MKNRFKLKKPDESIHNIIHVMLKCETCHAEFEDYITGISEAKKHVRETGHTVTGETGYLYRIEPQTPHND